MAAQIGAPGAAVRAHEELFAYWASLKDGALLPGRRHLDPGGIGKGYAVDRMVDVLKQNGFRTALVAGSGSTINP